MGLSSARGPVIRNAPAGLLVPAARAPGAVRPDAGLGQAVPAFGAQVVLVAEVVVALAGGIALPLPGGGTGGGTDSGLPGCRGGHTHDGGRKGAAVCGHLGGKDRSGQKAEDGQQAEGLAIHDETSWRETEGERKTVILRDALCPGIRLLKEGPKIAGQDNMVMPVTQIRKKRPSPAEDTAACPSRYPQPRMAGFGEGGGVG